MEYLHKGMEGANFEESAEAKTVRRFAERGELRKNHQWFYYEFPSAEIRNAVLDKILEDRQFNGIFSHLADFRKDSEQGLGVQLEYSVYEDSTQANLEAFFQYHRQFGEFKLRDTAVGAEKPDWGKGKILHMPQRGAAGEDLGDRKAA